MINDRIVKDSQGRQFIPMNVEGGVGESNFFNTFKIVCIAIWFLLLVVFIANIPINENLTLLGKIVMSILFIIFSYFFITKIVFEEKYYYAMYKKQQAYANPDTSVYWRVASIKNTTHGGILLYADGKVGVILKLDRGSIIGREDDFSERHFEAISEFIREIIGMGYRFVHLNSLEEASNDPRIANIEHLISIETNPNVKDALELQAGTIKRAMRATLYESDYILVYSLGIDNIDRIIDDANSTAFTLLDGCYTGYTILGSKEIIALHKELNGISYFDFTDASINVFRDMNIGSNSVLKLKRLNLRNGKKLELDEKSIKLLKQAVNNINNSDEVTEEISIAKILGEKAFNNATNIVNKANDWGVNIEQFEDKPVQMKKTEAKVKSSGGLRIFGNKVKKDMTDNREKPNLNKEMSLMPKKTDLYNNRFNNDINDSSMLQTYDSDEDDNSSNYQDDDFEI